MKLGELARTTLHRSGWQFEGGLPPEKKYVALVTPHTSNWDGLLLVALLQSVDLEMEWMIKDTWVKSPLGPVLRRLGAVAIDREHHSNMVQKMVEQFQRRERFVLGIPPEGTRARAPYWKSGFYRIALGAQVPVVPGYLDYARRRAGLGAAIPMTGDMGADMDRIPRLLRGEEARGPEAGVLRSDPAARRGHARQAVTAGAARALPLDRHRLISA